jgi:hypothetical protein
MRSFWAHRFSVYEAQPFSNLRKLTVFKLVHAFSLFAISGIYCGTHLLDTEGLIKAFSSNCTSFPQSGTVRINATFAEHPDLASDTEIRFLPDHFSGRELRPAEQGTNFHDQVLITNPHYSARLQRKESGWQVSTTAPADSEEYEGTSGKRFMSSLSLISDPVGVTTGTYEIDSTSEQSLLSKSYTVVNLKYPRKVPHDFDDIAEARLWFNKNTTRAYPERIETILHRGATGTYVYSQFISIGGIEYPSRFESCNGIFTSDEWNSNSPPKTGNVHEFDYSELSTIPKQSEFYLSHYGLPEPGFYNPPQPWWLYTSIGGGLILILGAVLLSVGRRLRRA